MDRNYRVYSYTNQITNQKYIGKTCFKFQSQRSGKEGSQYIKNCSAFGQSIQEYGWPNFKYEVLEDGLTKEEADIKEREYIEKFNTIYPHGLNLQSGGNHYLDNEVTRQRKKQNHAHLCGENHPAYGTHHTEEQKRKQRESELNHPNLSKRIQQFTKDGQFVAEYPSIAEVERQKGYANGNIVKCCKGRIKFAYGFVWKYA